MSEATADRVLVIGGTRGTGLLIARLLHARGHGVRVLARDPVRAVRDLGPAFDVVAGDLTKPDTLPKAVQGADHIVFTAGAPSGRYAPERLVRQTDYQGVVDTLAAARAANFRGRFLYLNSIGIATPSLAATLINLLKRNTLVWRRRVEDDIRASGIDYTIIRVGFLLDRPGDQRAVIVSQGALPLAPRHRIARADVASAFVEALHHPSASRATFEIVWGTGPRRESWDSLLDRLKPDA
ncbi:MAG TPA: SDR family oxidoreductase [Vineibacter sp.]|nr:SDR family oxidoreductase [Vineibacter sp.]